MKTMQNIKDPSLIRRVKDEEAEALKKQGWKYVPKKVWKKVRDTK